MQNEEGMTNTRREQVVKFGGSGRFPVFGRIEEVAYGSFFVLFFGVHAVLAYPLKPCGNTRATRDRLCFLILPTTKHRIDQGPLLPLL